MRVALLGPIAWRTPPRHYGPWEQVTSLLAEGLVREGVDVTLFATLDSADRGRTGRSGAHPVLRGPTVSTGGCGRHCTSPTAR